MTLLLDAHTLLWFLTDDPQLSGPAREAIEDAENSCRVSPATLWEIAIKVHSGKLRLPQPFGVLFPAELERNQLELQPILPSHLGRLLELPPIHRDPFDRLLVAQALAEGMVIVTRDPAIGRYSAETLW